MVKLIESKRLNIARQANESLNHSYTRPTYATNLYIPSVFLSPFILLIKHTGAFRIDVNVIILFLSYRTI